MAKPTGQRISLTDEQRTRLIQITKVGQHRSREIIRAHVLLQLDAGYGPKLVSTQHQVSTQTVIQIRQRFVDGGLERAVYDAPRSGAPAKITAYHEADLTVLACTDPPAGADRWTITLLSDEMVKMGYEEGVSRSSIYRIQKKVKSNRGRKPPGVLVD